MLHTGPVRHLEPSKNKYMRDDRVLCSSHVLGTKTSFSVPEAFQPVLVSAREACWLCHGHLQELHPMPLTHSAHPWEESCLAEIYFGGDHTHFSNPVNNSRIVLCESTQGGKKNSCPHSCPGMETGPNEHICLTVPSWWHICHQRLSKTFLPSCF